MAAPAQDLSPGGGDAPAQQAIATRIVQLDPEGDRNTRIVDVSVPQMVRRAAREREQHRGAVRDDDAPPPSLIDETLTRMRHFYMRMHRFDRWTCWLLLAALLCAFLPWQRERVVGLVSGIEGVLGWASVIASLAAFGLLYWRTERRRLAGLLIVGQLLCVAAIAAPAVYRMINAVGVNLAFGLYGTIGCAGLALLFTLARLTRINT